MRFGFVVRHAPGYGQPLYPSMVLNAYNNSNYGAPMFNTYSGSHGVNATIPTQGPVQVLSNLSTQNDSMPYAQNISREDLSGYGTSEPQSQSIAQRMIETRVTTGASQSHFTPLSSNAPHDGPRESRGNATSTIRRYANTLSSGQRPSYYPEVDVIMSPGDILEASRINANNDRIERARRRYGTIIQPGAAASGSARGSSQDGNANANRAARAAQARAEEDWQVQQYLRQVRAHNSFLTAMAQNRELARLGAERARRVAEASKPKGLDDKKDGRPPPKEAEELTVNLECKICMSQLVDTVVLPCGHAVMCRWCARQHMPGNQTSAKCPVCRVNIKVKVLPFNLFRSC